METLTDKEIEAWKRRIDEMSHYQMAKFYRFAPIGHPVFRCDLPLDKYFMDRFEELGGMTPALSKAIGWKVSHERKTHKPIRPL